MVIYILLVIWLIVEDGKKCGKQEKEAVSKVFITMTSLLLMISIVKNQQIASSKQVQDRLLLCSLQ